MGKRRLEFRVSIVLDIPEEKITHCNALLFLGDFLRHSNLDSAMADGVDVITFHTESVEEVGS